MSTARLAVTSRPASGESAELLAGMRPSLQVDAVGLLCPIPVTRTAKAMKSLTPGEILELSADDRVVLIDVPNWCLSWRHAYLGFTEEPSGILHLFVRKGAP